MLLRFGRNSGCLIGVWPCRQSCRNLIAPPLEPPQSPLLPYFRRFGPIGVCEADRQREFLMTWLEFPVSRRSEVGQSGAKRLEFANNFRRSIRSVVEIPCLLPFWRDGEPRSCYSL